MTSAVGYSACSSVIRAKVYSVSFLTFAANSAAFSVTCFSLALASPAVGSRFFRCSVAAVCGSDCLTECVRVCSCESSVAVAGGSGGDRCVGRGSGCVGVDCG